MHADEITGTTIEIAIEIHRALGSGLLESVYEAILAHELRLHGLKVRRQQPIRFQHGDMLFDEAFRADLIVEDTVVVEIKAVARLDPVYARQILTYLRLLDLPAGLVLNFGEKTMLAGTKRIVNKLQPFAQSRVHINRSADRSPNH